MFSNCTPFAIVSTQADGITKLLVFQVASLMLPLSGCLDLSQQPRCGRKGLLMSDKRHGGGCSGSAKSAGNPMPGDGD